MAGKTSAPATSHAPVLIVDFGHPAEDLAERAPLLHPRDATPATAQAQPWCQVLPQEGGAGSVRTLAAWALAPHAQAVRAKYTAVRGYRRNNAQRRDYPRYLAHGWLRGSGAVASVSTTVVGQRLQWAGLRGRADGTDAVCHVRALFRREPGQGHAFWGRQVLPPSRN